jgi:hypothetical protein
MAAVGDVIVSIKVTAIPPTARIAGMYNSIAPDTDAIWRRARIRSPVQPGIFSGESIFRIV